MVQHLQNLTVQEMCDLMLEIVRELQYRDYLARATRASPEIVPRSSRDSDSEDCSEWWSVLVAIAGLTVRRDLHWGVFARDGLRMLQLDRKVIFHISLTCPNFRRFMMMSCLYLSWMDPVMVSLLITLPLLSMELHMHLRFLIRRELTLDGRLAGSATTKRFKMEGAKQPWEHPALSGVFQPSNIFPLVQLWMAVIVHWCLHILVFMMFSIQEWFQWDLIVLMTLFVQIRPGQSRSSVPERNCQKKTLDAWPCRNIRVSCWLTWALHVWDAGFEIDGWRREQWIWHMAILSWIPKLHQHCTNVPLRCLGSPRFCCKSVLQNRWE